MTKFMTVKNRQGHRRVVPINSKKSMCPLKIIPSGMKNLKDAVTKEHKKLLDASLINIKSSEGLINTLRFEGKTYLGDDTEIRKKLTRYLEKKHDRRLVEDIAKITEIEGVKDFSKDDEFVITVDWTKSRMWGMNPVARTNYGFGGSYIGGCGYDKLSTATAEALNSHLPLLKLLYAKKNKYVNKRSHDILGYGSGYGLLPKFEGGVGVSSHQQILEGVGLEMRNISSTKTSDVFVVKKTSRPRR